MTEIQNEGSDRVSAAQNANTLTENTHKHYDFQVKGIILKLAFELRKLGLSEAYLKTLVRALNC
jgi:hypothetical protein